jgi:RNA 2',3'-cyclic 3'-phosphodiesterase
VTERPEPTATGPSARLFVALPVPAEVRDGLEDVAEGLRERAPELRFTRPDGWHVTLAFLGTVGAERIDEVGRVVSEVALASPAIDLHLAGPGRFGNRALWVGIDDTPSGAVAELGQRLQVAIAAAGSPVQEQDVRPHLTLARGGRGRPVRARYLDDLAELLETAADPGGAPARAWVADEVQVWRSELGRGPARYHVVARAPLSR